jgi:hypothetical protein
MFSSIVHKGYFHGQDTMLRPLSKHKKKVSILCFNWLNTILATPRQQLLEMANGTAMVMADGNGNCNDQR